jgi:hypothetical protein
MSKVRKSEIQSTHVKKKASNDVSLKKKSDRDNSGTEERKETPSDFDLSSNFVRTLKNNNNGEELQSPDLNLTLRDITFDTHIFPTEKSKASSPFILKIQKEAFQIDYCSSRKPELLPGIANYHDISYDLQLNISDWLDILDENLLSSVSSSASIKSVSLLLKDISNLPISICELLSNTLGNKISEIIIDNCPSFSWNNEMKALLFKVHSLISLRFKQIKWLDDTNLEYLIKRYKSTLELLEFERCHNITNNGFFQIGKYSNDTLKNLFVTCCSKVSDVGLTEIARKNHLLNIEFSHSLSLNDKGIEALLSAYSSLASLPPPVSALPTSSLYSFSLINCPSITNNAISYLYEINASWGKKRNIASSTIHRFIVRDNANITEESLLWVTAAARDLIEIDFRDCPNIELGKAITEMANLRNIKYLKIGSFQENEEESIENGGKSTTGKRSKGGSVVAKKEKKEFNVDYFLQGMIKLIPTLLTLQLVNIPSLLDDQLATLFDNAFVLTDLSLVKIPQLGTATIESICSNLPNLSKLEISYSSCLRDIDLRCISSVCFHLKSITLSHCPLITDAGFTRFLTLRYLEEFYMIHVSKHLTTTITKFLNNSPIKRITLQGVSSPSSASSSSPSPSSSPTSNETDGFGLRSLRLKARQEITEISLKDSSNVTKEDILYILHHFIYCSKIDLTSCYSLSPDMLATISHYNPFLQLMITTDFVGYSLTNEGNSIYRRYWSTYRQLQRHLSAKRIQKLRRRYLKKLEDYKEIRKEQWKYFKEYLIIRIQRVYRGYRVRKELARQQKAALIISKYFIKFMMLKGSLKLYTAKNFRRKYQLMTIFNRVKRYARHSREELKDLFKMINDQKEKQLKNKYFQLCKFMQKELIELAFEKEAMVLYHINFLKKVLFCWKKVLFSPDLAKERSSIRKQQLVHAFLAIVPLSHYNSSRQQRFLSLATSFNHKRLITIAWIEFAKDVMSRRRVDKLIPMAIAYAKKKFFQRVVGNLCYKAMKAYYLKRKEGKARKQLAHSYYIHRLVMKGIEKFEKNYSNRKFMKIAWMKSKSQRSLFLLTLAIRDRFPFYTINSIAENGNQQKAQLHFKEYIYDMGYHHYKDGILRDRRWRVMKKMSENHFHRLYYKKTIKGWKIFKQYHKHLDVYLYQKYLLKIAKKCLYSLRMNLAMEKDKTNYLLLKIKQNTNDEAHFLRVMFVIQRLQARIRGKLKQRKFNEERINKFYAIQTLQNFFRVVKARKEYNSRFKKVDIEEKVHEDTELDLMREEEIETRFFLYKLTAVITIQRVFRGYKGRIVGGIVAFEMRKHRGKMELLANQHLRDHHEAFLRALAAKEKLRANAAMEIQRVYRGHKGRKVFAIIKYQQIISDHAIAVQRAYQKRLAKLRLKAIKRDTVTEMRHLAAKRQRGLVLRSFGLMKRKYQNMIAPVLESFGMDPISFNYRYRELITETISDFEMLISIFHREKDLYKKHGVNSYNRGYDRRTILQEQGWKYKVQDAVRIIEPNHTFYGLTGIIVRIDESLVGNPLYEIRLDRYSRQTHLRMTTDPIMCYEQIQPLSKIQLDPDIAGDPHAHQYPSKFGLDPTSEFYSKKNVYAAWTIQRAFRVFRAKKIVARVRYEHWRKNINRHHSLLHHLSEANALSSKFLPSFIFFELTSLFLSIHRRRVSYCWSSCCTINETSLLE